MKKGRLEDVKADSLARARGDPVAAPASADSRGAVRIFYHLVLQPEETG